MPDHAGTCRIWLGKGCDCQPSLFNLPAARAARDVSMESVDGHASDTWKAAVDRAIEHTARDLETFTTEDVLARLPDDLPRVHDPRAWGPRMLAAVTAGLIQPTDEYRKGTLVRSHTRPKRVWRSIQWRGEGVCG